MKYAILFVFVALMILVGMISRRQIHSTEDYVLGGRRMGPWLSSFSYGTAYFSAVIFVGYAGRFGWSFGLSAAWIGVGNALIGSLLAWWLLAERSRRITQAMKANTMAEFFRHRYDSPGLEKFSALIIFIFLIPYSASVYQGLGYLMQRFFSGTVLADIRLSMLLMAVITAVYLYFGGYISTAVNSLIQGLIMLFGVVYMVWRVIDVVGGLRTGLADLAALTGGEALVSPLGPAPFDLIILILMTSLGTFGLPQMIGKFNGVRDRRSIRRATVMSTIFALVIGGGAYFMGGFSRLLNQRLNLGFDGERLDLLMPLIFDALLTPEMMAVLLVLMLSASMSTLAAVVLVSAPTFSRTVLRSDKMRTLRLMSLLFVFISFVVALIPGAIVTLMAFSWGAVSGAFAGPYLWGLFMRKVTRQAAAAGMAGGLGTVIIGAALTVLSGQPAATQAPRLAVLAIFVSLISVPLVSWLTRHQPLPRGAAYLNQLVLLEENDHETMESSRKHAQGADADITAAAIAGDRQQGI
ncbi:MAG: sodium:solute symporter [Eubacteriales bacterium]|nr:sodium:solute symporter [Eubacteriales bacterium]